MHHEEQFCEIILNLGQWFRRRCHLKDFLSGALAVLLFGAAEPYMQFRKRTSWGIFMWSYMEFGPVDQKAMPFKDISYLELWEPLCSADPNHLCNFCRRYHEEQFSEIILNLDQWFRRICRLEVFLIWISGSPFVQRSVTICANFARGHYEEQFCGIILNLGQWFRRRCRLKDFLSGALAAHLFGKVEPFMQFWKRASWGTFMWSYMKFGPVVQEEMSEEKGNRRTTDEPRWAKNGVTHLFKVSRNL